jgi:RNA polymerase sigma-70 factor (ECF subfamily)
MSDSHKPDTTYQEFIYLFDTYKVAVHDYVQKITGDHHTAEEITQELFIKLWKMRDRFGQIDNMDQYIYRMAHNASMTWFGKLAVDARRAKEVWKRSQATINNVTDTLDYREAQALLDKAIATLSPQRKKVFELSRREGLKIQEIADELNLSFNTVNHHLTAALAQVREYFMQYGKDSTLLMLLAVLLGLKG